MNNHGDHADIGDLVALYNAAGMPLGLHGLVIAVRERGSFREPLRYLRLKGPNLDDDDWHLASFARIVSRVGKGNV